MHTFQGAVGHYLTENIIVMKRSGKRKFVIAFCSKNFA